MRLQGEQALSKQALETYIDVEDTPDDVGMQTESEFSLQVCAVGTWSMPDVNALCSRNIALFRPAEQTARALRPACRR
jgi:hypothetical protein